MTRRSSQFVKAAKIIFKLESGHLPLNCTPRPPSELHSQYYNITFSLWSLSLIASDPSHPIHSWPPPHFLLILFIGILYMAALCLPISFHNSHPPTTSWFYSSMAGILLKSSINCYPFSWLPQLRGYIISLLPHPQCHHVITRHLQGSKWCF